MREDGLARPVGIDQEKTMVGCPHGCRMYLNNTHYKKMYLLLKKTLKYL